ncbi:MAG TPA: DUF1015 domain-containing protein [Candidatus Acidoferrales bacterium]|nr:DUF1015 domain-containing protein [Candidatus Acidoferrales bacterium]
MAEIRPFRAFRYNAERVSLKDALTQPYDKITPAMQERYYAASPYNLIAVEKGRCLPGDTSQNSVYTRAAQTFERWLSQKILVEDSEPGIYIYSQDYAIPGTQTRRTRTGFIALGRLEDYDAKVVFRHEHTLSGPKADRLELLRHTRAQTGQLFMLYDDASKKIEALLEAEKRKRAPSEMADEFSVTHRLWAVFDAAFVSEIQRQMADRKLVIADGHHRYETALNYRDERRAAGASGVLAASEFAMMTFVNSHSTGLTILPTHRVVRNVANFSFDNFRKALAAIFEWYSYPFQTPAERSASFNEFRRDLEERKHGRRAIGVYAGTGAFFLFLLRQGLDLEGLLPGLSDAQRNLDVVLLHRLMLEKGLGITAEAVARERNIAYEREMDAAIAAVDHDEAQLACILNPVDVQQVMGIALAGDVLPQKSTDFYPKLLSGIAIYRVEGVLNR